MLKPSINGIMFFYNFLHALIIIPTHETIDVYFNTEFTHEVTIFFPKFMSLTEVEARVTENSRTSINSVRLLVFIIIWSCPSSLVRGPISILTHPLVGELFGYGDRQTLTSFMKSRCILKELQYGTAVILAWP